MSASAAAAAAAVGLFPTQVSAVQVGTFFLRQYYNILQQHPEMVYQFYNEASTMVRVDDHGATTETATGIMQIHSLIISLNFTKIEIKTANFVNSWADGVLVMVSGLVQTKEYSQRRKFVQMFFLAPQAKGYYVLNDYFHFLDEEQVPQPTMMMHDNFENNLNVSSTVPETVPDYIHEEESQSVHEVVPVTPEEDVTINDYSSSEPPQQQVSQSDNWADEPVAEEAVASFSNGMTMAAQEPPPSRAVEHVGEPPVKKTYASIVRTAKGPSVLHATRPVPVSKPSHATSELNQAPQPNSQHSFTAPLTGVERPTSEVFGEVNTQEDEVESKSVYVGNVPSSVTEADLENEFKKFGRIIPDGVAIRSRKESGGYYAFVEFEDLSGVHNSLKASPIEINGWQIYVEERRPNSGMMRGGRRGRGRFGYQSEAPRGRFGGGRGYARGGLDTDYTGNRTRSNGLHQRVPHHERGILGSHAARNGQHF